jgi:hypothetical protein
MIRYLANLITEADLLLYLRDIALMWSFGILDSFLVGGVLPKLASMAIIGLFVCMAITVQWKTNAFHFIMDFLYDV